MNENAGKFIILSVIVQEEDVEEKKPEVVREFAISLFMIKNFQRVEKRTGAIKLVDEPIGVCAMTFMDGQTLYVRDSFEQLSQTLGAIRASDCKLPTHDAPTMVS